MNRIEDADAHMDRNGALESLRVTPPRDPARVAAGRAAMLAQARAAQRQRSLALFGMRLRRWRALFAIGAALLTGGAGAVYASQVSLPDSPLYTIKLVSEDVRLALASGADEQRALLHSFAERRRAELASTGESAVAERARSRLAEHEAALEVIERAQVSAAPILQATATPALPLSTPSPVTTDLAKKTQTDAPEPLMSTPEPIDIAIPTPLPPIAVAQTVEALPTRISTQITPTIAALEATRVSITSRLTPTIAALEATRVSIATRFAPTVEAMRATMTAMPNMRATAEAIVGTLPPPPSIAITPPSMPAMPTLPIMPVDPPPTPEPVPTIPAITFPEMPQPPELPEAPEPPSWPTP